MPRLSDDEDTEMFMQDFVADTPDGIDWSAVSGRFAGVEVNPYLPTFRDVMWYNMWDVASGVIWDTSRVKITAQRIAYLSGRGYEVDVSVPELLRYTAQRIRDRSPAASPSNAEGSDDATSGEPETAA